MEEQSRDDSGQFTAAGEHLTGLAAEEHKFGYAPMPAIEQPEEPEVFENIKDALNSLPPEPEEPEVEPAVYRNLETLEPSDPRHTLKIERAGNDIVEYEGMVRDSRAASISKDFAAAVDKMRGDFLEQAGPEGAQELGLDKEAIAAAKPAEAEQVAQKSDEPDPYADVDGLTEAAKQALRVPQVREAIEKQFNEAEQTKQAYSAGLNSANQFGQASILAIAPELAQVPFERWGEGINIIARSDPARGQQLAAVFNNVAAISERQQLIQHHNAQIQHQQFESQVKSEDQRLIEMVGSTKAADEANAALFTYLAENSVPRNQHLSVLKQNPVLTTAEARLTIAKAAKYDAIMAAPKALPSRPIPPVQKPGVYQAKASGPAAEIKALQRSLDGKSEAQQLRIARQIINLQAS